MLSLSLATLFLLGANAQQMSQPVAYSYAHPSLILSESIDLPVIDASGTKVIPNIDISARTIPSEFAGAGISLQSLGSPVQSHRGLVKLQNDLDEGIERVILLNAVSAFFRLPASTSDLNATALSNKLCYKYGNSSTVDTWIPTPLKFGEFEQVLINLNPNPNVTTSIFTTVYIVPNDTQVCSDDAVSYLNLTTEELSRAMRQTALNPEGFATLDDVLITVFLNYNVQGFVQGVGPLFAEYEGASEVVITEISNYASYYVCDVYEIRGEVERSIGAVPYGERVVFPYPTCENVTQGAPYGFRAVCTDMISNTVETVNVSREDFIGCEGAHNSFVILGSQFYNNGTENPFPLQIVPLIDDCQGTSGVCFFNGSSGEVPEPEPAVTTSPTVLPTVSPSFLQATTSPTFQPVSAPDEPQTTISSSPTTAPTALETDELVLVAEFQLISLTDLTSQADFEEAVMSFLAERFELPRSAIAVVQVQPGSVQVEVKIEGSSMEVGRVKTVVNSADPIFTADSGWDVATYGPASNVFERVPENSPSTPPSDTATISPPDDDNRIPASFVAAVVVVVIISVITCGCLTWCYIRRRNKDNMSVQSYPSSMAGMKENSMISVEDAPAEVEMGSRVGSQVETGSQAEPRPRLSLETKFEQDV